MKLLKILALTTLFLALTACSVSTRSVSPPPPPQLTEPDAALTKRCLRAVQLPDRAITQAELEELWGADRARLRTCVLRHGALSDFYAARDAELRGGP